MLNHDNQPGRHALRLEKRPAPDNPDKYPPRVIIVKNQQRNALSTPPVAHPLTKPVLNRRMGVNNFFL